MKNARSKRTVLAIGAHTDDIELGAGATLSRLKREGWYVVAVAASRAETSLPVGYSPTTLETEFRESMKIIHADHVAVLGYPVRRLNEYRQAILDDLIAIRRDHDPELIITHSSQDTHQDHEVMSSEVVRAFRARSVWGFHSPWNQREISSNIFVDIEKADLRAKIEMLSCYRSQAELGRAYVASDYPETAAKFAGYQAQLTLAESFEAITLTRRSDAYIW